MLAFSKNVVVFLAVVVATVLGDGIENFNVTGMNELRGASVPFSIIQVSRLVIIT